MKEVLENKPTKMPDESRKPIRHWEDLKVFQLADQMADEVFKLSKKFPREETYALTGQIRRSSRSIAANIVEGWSRRTYQKIFKLQLETSAGSCDETRYWLRSAKKCGYIDEATFFYFDSKYTEIGKMLGGLISKFKD